MELVDDSLVVLLDGERGSESMLDKLPEGLGGLYARSNVEVLETGDGRFGENGVSYELDALALE